MISLILKLRRKHKRICVWAEGTHTHAHVHTHILAHTHTYVHVPACIDSISYPISYFTTPQKFQLSIAYSEILKQIAFHIFSTRFTNICSCPI